MNSRTPKIYLDGITYLDILNYYNQFSVLKKIPGERFKPSKDIYAILKPCIAELNLVYTKVLGKEFIAKDSKFATKEVSWNIEQLEYIKNNMHLFYERNKPIINEYFEQTTFKGERERHYYENQIRSYLGARYMPWRMVTRYLKIFAQYLYYRNIRIKFYSVIFKFKQSLLMNIKNRF